jgi:hypothetical protein
MHASFFALLLALSAVGAAQAQAPAADERATARAQAQEEAVVIWVRTLAARLGGTPEAAARFAERLRGHLREHKLAPGTFLADASKALADEPKIVLTREQAEKLGASYRAFVEKQAAGLTTHQPPSPASRCWYCPDVFDGCLTDADTIFSECLGDVGDGRWCFGLYRLLLEGCLRTFQQCMSQCPV